MPYGPDYVIDKIECRDIVLRTYGTKLAAIVKNKSYPIVITRHIQMNQTQFIYALSQLIEYHRKLKYQTMKQKILGLLFFQIISIL